jgi:homogentisate 1,2-dioxygenase
MQAQVGAESRMGAEGGSYWIIGFNGGGAWQDSDILTRGGGGFSFYLGKSIYNRAKSPISIDARLRYMATWTYGQNHGDSTLGGNDNVLGARYGYNPDSSFFAHNHQTVLHDFSGELRLNFEQLRRKHRILFSLYGGIGLGFYNVRTDQLGLLGNPYNYDGINLSQSDDAICEDILFMRDDEYETNLYNRVTITPTVGFELGYWFSPHFALAIGHRTSFTLADRFDGFRNNEVGDFSGAIHHYTALNFHWRLFPTTRTVECPDIEFQLPVANGKSYTTREANAYIEARITNSSREQITYTVNGQTVQNYTHSSYSKEFRSNITLRRGENTISIKSQNSCGMDAQQVTIIYIPENEVITPPQTPPTVLITNPGTTPTNISTYSTTITATIKEVASSDNVSFVVNGVPVRNFSFSGTSFVANGVNLQEGSNTITVRGTNTAGSDTKTVIINYIKEVTPEDPPVVNITSPQPSPYATTNSRVSINATILNVNDRRNVTFKVNGQNSTNFSFSGTSFVANSIVLQQGNNTFTVKGTNNAGQDVETVVVIYTKPTVNLPVVTITSPTPNPTTVNVPATNCTANILYVPTRSGVTCTVNGQAFNSFSFAGTRFTASNIPLVQGSNTITITGSNEAGQDVATTVVIYQAPVVLPPPVVNITYPNTNPFNTQQSSINLSATIQHVTSRNDVTFTVNGSQDNRFSFSGGVFNASNITLRQGRNVFTVTGRNSVGKDMASTIVVYTQPTPPPVVTITNPRQNPLVTTNGSVNLTASILNVNSRNDVTFTINGRNVTNFNFSGTNFSANGLNLIVGANTFTITGRNSAGQDSKSTVVIYNKEEEPAPIVTITTPNQNPFNTQVATTNIRATILNVASANDVTFNVNGQNVRNFTFSGTTFTANGIRLNQGSNTFTITGTNGTGRDSKSTVVVYTVPTPAPVVTITAPDRNPETVNTPTTVIRATIRNVANSSGVTFTVNGQANTSFSYSNGTFRSGAINLNPGNNTFTITGTNRTGRDSKSTVVIYVAPTPAPVVTITTPNQNPFNTQVATTNIRATILNVASANDVTFNVNGQNVRNFTFSGTTFTANGIRLNQGSNTFTITGTNSTGRDSKSTVVVYTVPTPAPVVTITAPDRNPETVNTPTTVIRATIRNVANSSGVTFTVNGQTNTSFSYSNGTFRSGAINLNPGNNTFTITGANSTGRDSKSTVVIYVAPEVKPKPTVVITNPSQNPFNTQTATINIQADIRNVASANDVTFTVNGQAVRGFTLNRTAFVANGIALRQGSNTFTISGRNSEGQANASTVVVYTAPTPAPVVTITAPDRNPETVSTPTAVIRATIRNVANSSGVTFTVNGQPNTSFTYSNGTFRSGAINLNPGNNTFTVTGTNSGGTDTKSTVVIYNQPVTIPAPVVTITSPSTNPYTSTTANVNIQATITNVSSSSGVTFTVNGRNETGFRFRGIYFAMNNIPLNPGNNTFTIRGVNAAGQDTKSTIVIYSATPPPVVTITAPDRNPERISTPDMVVRARIQNVATSRDITFTVNGQPTTAFSYSNGTFNSSPVRMRPGNNTIAITGRNTAGQDVKSTVVIYTPAVPKPTINIINPRQNPFTTNQRTVNLQATVLNVAKKADVTFLVNGRPYTNFTLNRTSLVANGIRLSSGNNTFSITARNASGQATKAIVVIYNTAATVPNTTIGNTPAPDTTAAPTNDAGTTKTQKSRGGSNSGTTPKTTAPVAPDEKTTIKNQKTRGGS